MANVIYSAIASLDGYVEDASGRFDWAAPDHEVHSFVNDLVRPIGTYLYGRRMYETMRYWENSPVDPSVAAPARDFAQIWRAADKVVYSRTLASVSSARTRIEPSLDVAALQRVKASSSHDLAVGGADLAGQVIEAGLVDELQLFVVPVVVGGGKPWLPGRVRLDLALLESRQFGNGFVFLRYRPELIPG
jgi:dihydrofolate reductase